VQPGRWRSWGAGRRQTRPTRRPGSWLGVRTVTVAGRAGRQVEAGPRARGRVVVVSCSSIESARLLLNSRRRHSPDGLGNGQGLVGQNLTFSNHRDGFARFDLAKQKDDPRSICWNAKGQFNDTNALAIRTADKSKYGSNLSDLAKYLKDNPKTTVCIQSEFRTRNDGVPGLANTYGIDASLPGYKDIGSNTAEKQLVSKDCEVGEVFTGDSYFAAHQDLYILQDDKKLFPPDNVGLVVRSDVLKKYPAIATFMAPVATKLTTDVMVDLNRQVEVDKKKVSDVAQGWLTQNGLL